MIPYIWEKMMENEIMGLSIALVDDRELVWARGFGYADLEDGEWATESTVYQIGSISKTLTATALTQLSTLEGGTVDIDKPLTAYLPEFSIHTDPLRAGPAPPGPITVRSLLAHHSGIPGNDFNGMFATEPRPDGGQRILDYLAGTHAAYPPWFIWSYSNLGFDLLGEVVARVSGRPFSEYSRGLLDSMGMRHSSFRLDLPFIREHLARGYYGTEEVDYYYDSSRPSGGCLSNVLDLARFIEMINAGGQSEGEEILRPETLYYMLSPQNGNVPLDFDFRLGLCWILRLPEMDYAGPVCWHSGATVGYRSQLAVLREHKLGVVVLSNLGTSTFSSGDIIDTIGCRVLQAALEEKTGLTPVPAPTPAWSPQTSCAWSVLTALEGIYITHDMADRFAAVTNGLEWNTTLPPDYLPRTLRLVRRENGWFSLPDSQELQLGFARISGREVAVAHGAGGAFLWGEKYLPPPVPEAWSRRFGWYLVDDLDHRDCTWFVNPEMRQVALALELREEGGIMVIKMGEMMNLFVEPLTDEIGVLRGLGRNRGEAVNIISGAGEDKIRFWGSTYRKFRSRAASGDYDGDGQAEITLFRPWKALWAERGLTRVYFGNDIVQPVGGDYDTDGTTDIAVFRPAPAPALWAVRGITRVYFGEGWERPVPADYDGDGTCEPALFDDENGLWTIRNRTRLYFGAENDYPVSRDYDGDGRADIAIFRPAAGLWALYGVSRFYFGRPGDLPVPADYLGSGTSAAGVFRPSSGLWAVRGTTRVYFGRGADQPLPADYGPSGASTVGIYRPDSGLWALRGITRAYYGMSGDIPVSK